MLAVLPASHHIRLASLRSQVGKDVSLAGEGEIDALFFRIAHMAHIPPVGEMLGLERHRRRQRSQQQPEVYLEGGDHATLIRMSREQYERILLGGAARSVQRARLSGAA